MDACVDCKVPLDPVEAPWCGGCQRLQGLPKGISHFRLLGLPHSHALTPQQVDAAFRARSRLVHPDKVGRSSDHDRRVAAQRTAALTEALGVLKSEDARALYLLQLAGVPLPKDSDPALLAQLMDDREWADESAQNHATLLNRTLGEKESLRALVVAQLAGLEKESALLDAARMTPVATTVMKLRYVSRLLEDLQGVKAVMKW